MSKAQENTLLKAYRESLALARGYERSLRSIVEAGHNMAASKDITEIMESMLELAVRVSGAQFACAALMQNSNVVFFSGQAPIKKPGKFPLDTAFSRNYGLSGLLMRTKISYICNIAEGDRYLKDDVKDEYDIKNYISVPILAKNGNFLGLLEAYNKNLFEPFDGNDAEILNTLASSTAIAVERFRIYVEFGKFGDEVQRIVDETFDAESALSREREKLAAACRELESVKKSAKRAKAVAGEITALKEDKMPAAREKASEIIGLLSNE